MELNINKLVLALAVSGFVVGCGEGSSSSSTKDEPKQENTKDYSLNPEYSDYEAFELPLRGADEADAIAQYHKIGEYAVYGDVILGKHEELQAKAEVDTFETLELNGLMTLDTTNPDANYSSVSNSRKWTNGVVPYDFSYKANFDSKQKDIISAAMRDIEASANVKFVPRQSHHKNYITFINGGGCYAYAGMWGGQQPVSLSFPEDRSWAGCVTKGVAIHELMHTLGFMHEQTRYDRDDYVYIYWGNLTENGKSQYTKLGQYSTKYGEYDYDSIMHYGEDYFAKEWGLKTMVPRDTSAKIGQRKGLSAGDISALKQAYGDSTVTGGTTTGGGTGGGTGTNTGTAPTITFMDKDGYNPNNGLSLWNNSSYTLLVRVDDDKDSFSNLKSSIRLSKRGVVSPYLEITPHPTQKGLQELTVTSENPSPYDNKPEKVELTITLEDKDGNTSETQYPVWVFTQ